MKLRVEIKSFRLQKIIFRNHMYLRVFPCIAHVCTLYFPVESLAGSKLAAGSASSFQLPAGGLPIASWQKKSMILQSFAYIAIGP